MGGTPRTYFIQGFAVSGCLERVSGLEFLRCLHSQVRTSRGKEPGKHWRVSCKNLVIRSNTAVRRCSPIVTKNLLFFSTIFRPVKPGAGQHFTGHYLSPAALRGLVPLKPRTNSLTGQSTKLRDQTVERPTATVRPTAMYMPKI